MKKTSQTQKFRTIRRVVGISAMILALAIGLVPVRSTATTQPSAPEDKLSVEIEDLRENIPDDVNAGASVLGVPENTILRIEDVPEEESKALPLLLKSGEVGEEDLSRAFRIRLTTLDNEPTSYQSMTLTLPLPEEYRISGGYVEILGLTKGNGLGTVLAAEESGAKSVAIYLSALSYPEGEFVLIYKKTASDAEYGTIIAAPTAGPIKVRDNRSDCSDAAKTTAAVEENYSEDEYLHVTSSEGRVILPLLDAEDSLSSTQQSIFSLTLTDRESGGKPVTDVGTVSITMAVADGMDPESGTITLCGVASDGTLKLYEDATLTIAEGKGYLSFETAAMNEYAILYTANRQSDVPVVDENGRSLSGQFSAVVTDTTRSYRLVVRAISGNEEKSDTVSGEEAATELSEEQSFLASRIDNDASLSEATESVYYDMTLMSGEKEVTEGFGTCTITMILPESMDISAGELQVCTVKTAGDGSFELEKPGVTGSETQNAITFTMSHFTPVAVLYENTTVVEEEVSEEEVSEEEISEEAGASATDSSATAAPSTTQSTPLTSSTQSTDSSSATPAGTTATPSATTPSTTTPSAVTATPAAGTNNTSAGTSSLPGTTGSTASTARTGTADMPKTADATTYRNVIVMILLVFGALMLVSSFRFEKVVRRRKNQ